MRIELKALALAAILAPFATEALGDEPDESAPAAAEPAPPKKLPKKKVDGYASWDEAAAVAEAWEQPVVAFIELRGDKASSKVRMNTFANTRDAFMKDFIAPNAVYYHYAVPQVEVKQQRGRNNSKAKDEPPKPDMAAIKASERAMVTRFASGGGKMASLPVVAVVAPGGGRMLGTVTYEDGPTGFGEFVEGLRKAMESGGYKVSVGPKVQKRIDADAKKAAKLKK